MSGSTEQPTKPNAPARSLGMTRPAPRCRGCKRGRVFVDPAPLSFPTSRRWSRCRHGRPAAAPVERSAPASQPWATPCSLAGGAANRRAAPTTSGRRLQLTGLARLRVMALSSQVGEDARLLHLLLEALERPVEAIIIAELNLDQSSSLLSCGWYVDCQVKTRISRQLETT